MTIAIIKSSESISHTGGVLVQGIMWKTGLEELGHDVELINFWEPHNWSSYDAIIILDFGGMYRTLMHELYKQNKKIIVAPIIDPTISKYLYKFYVKYWGSQKFLGLSSRYHNLYLCRKLAALYLTRSKIEQEYLTYSCDLPIEKAPIVPLSLRFDPLNEMPSKENFCFHASRLASYDKNVSSLIQAAIKYKFNLVLAGILYGKQEKEWLDNQISNHPNIKYVGVLSDSELCSYYKRAKVFALPSFVEGVGMVALEAAGYGCEIVLTDLGAPKEYYNGRAELVNPKSIDSIGIGIMNCLKKGRSQPELLQFIKNNYSLRACSLKLEQAIKSIQE